MLTNDRSLSDRDSKTSHVDRPCQQPPVALKAAASICQQPAAIAIIGTHKSPEKLPYPSLEALVQEGQLLLAISGVQLRDGEAKTKIVFPCFSSGTTGKPKTRHLHFYLNCE